MDLLRVGLNGGCQASYRSRHRARSLRRVILASSERVLRYIGGVVRVGCPISETLTRFVAGRCWLVVAGWSLLVGGWCVVVLVNLVTTGSGLLTQLRTFGRLVVLEVLTASNCLSTVDLLTALIWCGSPLATHCAVGHTFESGCYLLELARLRVCVVNLANSSIAETGTFRSRISTRPTISCLKVGLTSLRRVVLTILIRDNDGSQFCPISMVLVRLHLRLRVTRIISSSCLLSDLSTLSRLRVRRASFTQGNTTSIRLLLTLTGRLRVLLRNFRVVARLVRLQATRLNVLLRSLTSRHVLLSYGIMVFLDLRVLLTQVRFFLIRHLLVLVKATLNGSVLQGQRFLITVIRTILLRQGLNVTGRVLLFNGFTFNVRGLRIRVQVTRFRGRVTLICINAFVRRFLRGGAAFFKASLRRKSEGRLSVRQGVVIRLHLLRNSGTRSLSVRLRDKERVTRSRPGRSYSRGHSSTGPYPVLTERRVFFLFCLCVRGLSCWVFSLVVDGRSLFSSRRRLRLRFLSFTFRGHLNYNVGVRNKGRSFFGLPTQRIVNRQVKNRLLLRLVRLLNMALYVRCHLNCLIIGLTPNFLRIRLYRLPIITYLLRTIPIITVVGECKGNRHRMFTLIITGLQNGPVMLPFLERVLVVINEGTTARER